MQCDKVQQELPAYLHGRMSPADRDAIEAHLATCRDCAEEAVAMKELGDKLSKGLKEWVNEGTCPPELLEQIEQRLRGSNRPRWWKRWPVVAAVAAVALVLLVGARQDLPGQIASLPLVGTLATQIWGDDDGPGPTGDEGLGTDEHTGVTFRVVSLRQDGGRLRVECLVQGNRVDTLADAAGFTLSIRSGDATVQAEPVRVIRKQGQVVIEAELDADQVGERFTVALERVPVKVVDSLTGGGERILEGPWRVEVHR